MSGWDAPAVNALLNATSASLVLAGLVGIRAGSLRVHITCMVGACAVSAAFLVSYLVYHAQVGSVRFQGSGWVRPVYFTVLVTHTVLAVAIVPLVVRVLLLAAHRRFDRHVAWARVTVPLWLYVSGSGIAVYWLLYRSPWRG